MTDSATLEALREIQFLKNISPELLSQLAAISRILDLPGGTVIFRQGDPARTIYLVCDGRVSIELCASGIGCQQVMTAGPGELLGWSPVLEQARFTATTRTLEPTRLIEIDGAGALATWKRAPELGYEFMRKAAIALAKRLNATRLQLLNVYGTDVPKNSFAAPAADAVARETAAP